MTKPPVAKPSLPAKQPPAHMLSPSTWLSSLLSCCTIPQVLIIAWCHIVLLFVPLFIISFPHWMQDNSGQWLSALRNTIGLAPRTAAGKIKALWIFIEIFSNWAHSNENACSIGFCENYMRGLWKWSAEAPHTDDNQWVLQYCISWCPRCPQR